jgi:hypothetical protein
LFVSFSTAIREDPLLRTPAMKSVMLLGG